MIPSFPQKRRAPLIICAGLVAVSGLLSRSAWADVQLPAIISDHMVLKKGTDVPIWGKAAPGEEISVSLDGVSAKTKAGKDGKWRVLLDLSKSFPGPFEMTVAGKNKIAINDVLVGEVWLASGQSNMALVVKMTTGAESEIAGSSNPMLRQFFVDRALSDKPADDCQGRWEVAAPATTGNFSAVAYFFAKHLQKELGVPVGFINSSVGGTPCEAWISPEAIDTQPHLKEAREAALKAEAARAGGDGSPQAAGKRKISREDKGRTKKEPSVLFNGMINPLVPYAINGVVWYQGEANVDRAWQYRSAFQLLIRDWRAQWGQADLPFYFCQLASHLPKLPQPSDSAIAELREAQSMALKLPDTGQAVLIDIGESNDIHPKNKRDVGDRLAAIALVNHYGKKAPFSGPVYQSMKVEGGKIRLTFAHVDGGLVAKALPATYIVKSTAGETAPLVRNSPNSQLEGFAISGADHKWVWADAKIDGDSVVVWSDKVPAPVAVRYAWADNPTCNLSNASGLPASPFRTDDDPAMTRDVVY